MNLNALSKDNQEAKPKLKKKNISNEVDLKKKEGQTNPFILNNHLKWWL